jgi:hypothetical protein
VVIPAECGSGIRGQLDLFRSGSDVRTLPVGVSRNYLCRLILLFGGCDAEEIG